MAPAGSTLGSGACTEVMHVGETFNILKNVCALALLPVVVIYVTFPSTNCVCLVPGTPNFFNLEYTEDEHCEKERKRESHTRTRILLVC